MFKKICLFYLSALFFFTNSLTSSLPFVNPAAILAEAAEQSNPTIWSSADGKVDVDASEIVNGYIKVRYNGQNPNVKVIITKDGSSSYPYWLENAHEYEAFTLSFGSGSYHIMVLENTQGNYFSLAFSTEFSVHFDNANSPYLHPNFFVNYNDDTNIVKTASLLYAQSTDTADYVNKVYEYVKQYTYDFEKSNRVSSPNALYKTNLDEIDHLKEGICLDYAAVMTAMLRSQGVPAKLEFGYIDSIYHSWANVFIEDHWEIFDPTLGSALDDAALTSLIHNPNYYNPIFIN